MKGEVLPLRFEKILDRALARGQRNIDVIGTDSTLAAALFLSQSTSIELWRQPQLIVTSTAQAASAVEKHLRFFAPMASVTVLPSFDVSPYSGLYPNARSISARVRWVHAAQKPDVRHFFVASIQALCQRTIPPAVLRAHSETYTRDKDLPADFARRLNALGYQSVPMVEDEGTFAVRGGIVDIFSPAAARPVRIELFGDTIESLRFFNPDTQRSEDITDRISIVPAREVLFDDDARVRAAGRIRENAAGRKIEASDRDLIVQSIGQGRVFPGLDFLIGDFYEDFSLPIDHFSAVDLWLLNPLDIEREMDSLFGSLSREFKDAETHAIRPAPSDIYIPYDKLPNENVARQLTFSKIEIQDHPLDESGRENVINVTVADVRFAAPIAGSPGGVVDEVLHKVHSWREDGNTVLVAAGTHAQAQRLIAFLEKSHFRTRLVAEEDFDIGGWVEDQLAARDLIHIVPRDLDESLRFQDEALIFLRDEDFFGKKQMRRRDYKSTGSLTERTHALAFADIKPGDAIVHEQHGIGIYEGLKVMPIAGVDAEFIALSYKEGDKLYLPIYRIGQLQKYSGPRGEHLLDKLGGTQWAKTKIKVRGHLRELAADLLALYAKRSQIHRPQFPANDDDFARFEGAFLFDETDDQLKAIDDITRDMTSDRPMDRLVCGDVGFGKTEVAMRAAFKAIEGRRQVAILAPTTVLSFQHLETFQSRFSQWPIKVRALNRFVPPADVRKTIQEARDGQVDIVIGTHRLLSKDVVFKDLGLLIIDEEQRFGVTHKERIKKMRTSVDTLTLSATPIPRTLNMSLVGMRDLSIINTPPVDRLPTRTFVTRFDEETVGKAIRAEIQRGGQVFFVHNRVQSIHGVADDIRRIVPEARIRIGHGQMQEDELEDVMVAFYHHQIDVLVCTTIIESGIDNPRANTMFIDNAHQFGLSQLYQLRGRVGRSKERAYCYLLIPGNRRIEADAQERLKIIQENTALGSGIRIAQHDLELRGSGNILGEDQSGNIDAVGYEMYLELLEEAIREVKGDELIEEVEPEINVRIPALIPDSYIGDIRIRLAYYKSMSTISRPEDMDRIEDELRDQFGKLPDQVLNLMGLMLLRHHCRELGVRDLSSGPKSVSLAFTERTPLPPAKIVRLAQMENKKYSLTPDMRLNIRLDAINWPNIYDELLKLKSLCAGS